MRLHHATFLTILAVLSSGCQVRQALKQPIPASAAVGAQDERTQRIGEVIRDAMRKEGIPGVSVAVIDGGQIAWAQGFGWRDVGKRLPVDTDTQFQVASISKPVTALAVLKLQEAGQLDLDRDVNGYFKDWHLDSKWPDKPVTLRLLLCHRAGMVPHGFLGYGESKAPLTLQDVLNSAILWRVGSPATISGRSEWRILPARSFGIPAAATASSRRWSKMSQANPSMWP